LRNELEGGRLRRLADRRSGETRSSERCRASGKKFTAFQLGVFDFVPPIDAAIACSNPC
jgi:hypothetical protein